MNKKEVVFFSGFCMEIIFFRFLRNFLDHVACELSLILNEIQFSVSFSKTSEKFLYLNKTEKSHVNQSMVMSLPDPLKMQQQLYFTTQPYPYTNFQSSILLYSLIFYILCVLSLGQQGITQGWMSSVCSISLAHLFFFFKILSRLHILVYVI